MLQLGSPLDRAITEKGVLQLLFDARFLSNALAGGRPTAPEQAQPNGTQPQPGQHIGYSQAGAAGSAAQKQRKKAFTELERSLQVRELTSRPWPSLLCLGVHTWLLPPFTVFKTW